MQKDILDNVLVTGGNGAVASYIDFGVKTDRSALDITNLDQVKEVFLKIKPKFILHLAAETDLAKCEADKGYAYLVNSVGTYNLAIVAKMVGAKMVYVSTDSVFAHADKQHNLGEEALPESVYGHSKYLGELAVMSISDDYVIARTSWVFGGGKEKDKKFVAKFISQLDKTEVSAVDDQRSSPTYARDLVNALKDLILNNKSGIFHISNAGVASRYDMAKVIIETLNKETKVLPVSANIFNVPRYQYSSGGLVGNVDLRSWQEALEEYIKTEW